MAFELVQMVGPEIVDGQVTVIGPEIDSVPEGFKLPLGIRIDIYGRKMQAGLEGVLKTTLNNGGISSGSKRREYDFLGDISKISSKENRLSW